MIGKVRIVSIPRCVASVSHGRMGMGQCCNNAKNGDLCHLHAAKEDRGKTVDRVPKSRRIPPESD